MRLFVSLCTAAVLLTGCAGIQYAQDNYGSTEMREMAYGGETFRIFDKPQEGRLMITPSIGTAASGGFVRGATLGGVSGGQPPVTYRHASEEFLRRTGRTCAVTSIDLIVDPQWEARYSCG